MNEPHSCMLLTQFVRNGAAHLWCPVCNNHLDVSPPTATVTAICRQRTVIVEQPRRPWFPRVRRAWSLWLSFRRAMRTWRRAGKPRPAATDLAARQAACAVCPLRGSFLGASTCTACGCLLRIKQRMATEHCPKAKWPGDNPKKPCGCGKKRKQLTGDVQATF